MFMWPRLSWRKTKELLPAHERQRVGDPESAFSFSESESAIDGVGLGSELRCVNTNQGAISLVRFLPDGKHTIICGKDGVVRQWKVEQGNDHLIEVGQLGYSAECMNGAVVSKDGRWIILAGTCGRRVSVWDATTRERTVESVEAHEQKITALDISQDGSKIASGSDDGTIIIWCLETGERLAGPFRQGHSVSSVQFSPAGDRLASAGWNYSVHIRNISSNDYQCIIPIPSHLGYSLTWSNDGRHLFSGSGRYQGSIQCFDLSSSTPTMSKWPCHPHSDTISTLRLSNNGKFMVSASRSECTVKVLDIHTRSEIYSLKHASEVLVADISPDDTHLVSGTQDGQTCIWNLRKVLPVTYFSHSLTVCLEPISGSNSFPILTIVSNMAYISWRQAELARAEDILSTEIECRSSPLHYHLANRALVRARLRQWDKALDDAQTSLQVKPSLVAILAKSFAQSGQELYDTAIEILEDALKRSGEEERDFINVVKALTLFNAGRHGEAIHHLSDLVVRSPDVGQFCYLVQARMYTLLAEAALSSGEHTKAISLFTRARDLCPSGHFPELDTISIISGWKFGGLRLAIHRQLCEACYTARHLQEALDAIRKMESIFRDEIKLRNELKRWLTDFKSRCVDLLESQGDEAMQTANYDTAIARYSAGLEMNPAVLPAGAECLFVKRSKAWVESCRWEDALNDADEAVRLNPSSPWGHERRHAALHKLKRYREAIDALVTIISILENSPDPGIRKLRSDYIHPSDTRDAIWKVFKKSTLDSPFRLIDTTSGQLCDAEKRSNIFREDSTFQELVSSMTTQLHKDRIEAVTRRYFQYAMLSHRWGAKELELVDVLDKSVYELDTSAASTKLKQFCRLARDSECRWAWSDTCCINKHDNVEFEKSIHSMFRWYRFSATTIVYLVDVPPQLVPGALKSSIWMKRGWTLQELLAPPIIRFYHEDWTPYLGDTSHNHKASMVIMQELEDATGVTKHDLLAFRPCPENARVKLRLASRRETKEPEDMAYGLFGIFGVTMPVIRGESQQTALGRLYQEIVALSGDVACLAWVGRSSEFNSAFPDDIQAYTCLIHTIVDFGEAIMEKRVIGMQQTWAPEEETQANEFYRRLSSLPPARCTDRCLYLPCIVFPLTAFKKVEKTGETRVYRATAKVLEDTYIRTEKFLARNQGSEDFVLVCPWVHELLGSPPLPFRDGRRQSSGDAVTSTSDSDSESDSEPASYTIARERGFDSGSARDASIRTPESSALLHSDPSRRNSIRMDALSETSRLVVRLRQPLGALLLLKQGRGQYRRVATEHEIVVNVRKEVSLDKLKLEILEVR